MDKDSKILKKYQQLNPWGITLSVDLYQCDPKIIRSKKAITEFVDQLCQLLSLRKFGQAQIISFGDNPRVTGYSLTQLIETSLISGHFANQTNSAYLDLFSCKVFPPYESAKFAKNFFKAKKMRVKINLRY